MCIIAIAANAQRTQTVTARSTAHRAVTSRAVTSRAETSSNIELPRTAKGTAGQIVHHYAYTTNFNPYWQIPNWVAYDLTKRETKGSVKRPNKGFKPDPMLRSMLVTHSDYTNSGYSRGHMAPAADMKWSERAMEESFFLSNVCPQKAELNDRAWKKLEERVRSLAQEGTVYICCGPIVRKNPRHIGKHGVAVPDKFFKVVCMQRKGKWQAIGFIFPNSTATKSIFTYAMSVDEVERITGHDFFYALPDNIEKTIEARYDEKDWR